MTDIEETRERRLDAYIEFLENAYQVDGYGLADLIGMSRSQWTRNMRAAWVDKRWSFFVGLASLTGISLDWLIAE